MCSREGGECSISAVRDREQLVKGQGWKQGSSSIVYAVTITNSI